jgi:hypothetical protein
VKSKKPLYFSGRDKRQLTASQADTGKKRQVHSSCVSIADAFWKRPGWPSGLEPPAESLCEGESKQARA